MQNKGLKHFRRRFVQEFYLWAIHSDNGAMKIINRFFLLCLLIPLVTAHAQKVIPPDVVPPTPQPATTSGTKDNGGAGATAGASAGTGNGISTINDPGPIGGSPTVQPPNVGTGVTSAAQMEGMIANQVNQIGYDPNRRCPIAIDPSLTLDLLPANLSTSITQLAAQLTAPGQPQGCINAGRQLQNLGTPDGNNNVEYLNRLMGVAELGNQCSQSRDGIIDSVMGLALQFTSGPASLAILGGSALFQLSRLFSNRNTVTTASIYTAAQRGAITNMLQAGLTCSLNNTINTTTCWEVKRNSIDGSLRSLPEVDPATSVCENPPAPAEAPAVVAPAAETPVVAPVSNFAANFRIIDNMYACFDQNRNASTEDKQQCVTCNLTSGTGSYRDRFSALRALMGRDAATIAAAREQQLPAITVTARDYHNQKIVDFYEIIENSNGMDPSYVDVEQLINHCYYGDITRSVSASNIRGTFNRSEIEGRDAQRRHDRASTICANVDKCFQGSSWYNSSRYEGVRPQEMVCRKIYEIDNNAIGEHIDEMVMNLMSRITVNRNKNQIACNGYQPTGGAADSSGTSRQ